MDLIAASITGLGVQFCDEDVRVIPTTALVKGQVAEFDLSGQSNNLVGDTSSGLVKVRRPTANGRLGHAPHVIALSNIAAGEKGYARIMGRTLALGIGTTGIIRKQDGLVPNTDGYLTPDTTAGDRIRALALTRIDGATSTPMMVDVAWDGVIGFTTQISSSGGGVGGHGIPEVPIDVSCDLFYTAAQQCTGVPPPDPTGDYLLCPETYDDLGTPRDLNACCRREYHVRCSTFFSLPPPCDVGSVSRSCFGYVVYCCYASVGVQDIIPAGLTNPLTYCADDEPGSGANPVDEACCESNFGDGGDGWDPTTVACFVLTPA